jgi:hypothetical protein
MGGVAVDLLSAPGDLVAIFAGQLGAPTAVPGFGVLYLDLTGFFAAIAVGTQSQSGHFGFTLPVPINQALLGAHFAWQGLSGTFATGLRLSNPAAYVH